MWFKRDFDKLEHLSKRGRFRDNYNLSWETRTQYRSLPLWYKAYKYRKWMLGKKLETVESKFREIYDPRFRGSFEEFFVAHVQKYPIRPWYYNSSRIVIKGYVQSRSFTYTEILRLTIQRLIVTENEENFETKVTSKATRLFDETLEDY